MVASGRVAYLARRGPDYGVHTGTLRINMERVRKRKRDIVNLFRSGGEKRIANTKNLDLIYGVASFTAPKPIAVRTAKRGDLPFTADRYFLNAGCRPAIPNLPGLAGVPFLTSTSIMELAKVPSHLLVLGGGYVGLEFAQLFRRLRSRGSVGELLVFPAWELRGGLEGRERGGEGGGEGGGQTGSEGSGEERQGGRNLG